ncbi:hypothetical protein [Ancylobacter sp.]|uniref:hypothetical protein n=1 Tax=Ancylobacter sp. TaxID=1872567 RepID=UPI003C7A1573
MKPAEMIAVLDRSLVAYGEGVTLRRGAEEVSVRACVRGYLPDELGGGVVQGDRRLILSPTGFPFAWSPRVGDKAVVGGRVCAVMAVDLIRTADVVSRIEMRVRG